MMRKIDSPKPTPSREQIARFIAVFERLDEFEAVQRHIRGYGAFYPVAHAKPDPDPAVVEVMGWLRELAS